MTATTTTICAGQCARPVTVERMRADTVPDDGSVTLWWETPYGHTLDGGETVHQRHEGAWIDRVERREDGRYVFHLDTGWPSRGFLPHERVLIGR